MDTPQAGQSVIVRNRPAVIRDVTAAPGPGPGGEMHVLEVEYLDGYGHPDREALIWEREVDARVLSALRLPKVDDASRPPADPDGFAALLDALRWSSVGRGSPLADDSGRASLVCPWHGAVQVEDYQLYPVLKAMAMPRVSLLLADDVGLGKTIEAALIASELIARRRIRRILILCPAALQIQWHEEMRDKFSLEFTVMHRDGAFRVQQSLGMDANPWATTPRVITSMDYLRQPDVLDRFRQAAEALTNPQAASVAWDLIIVDEAHNLSPSSFADDSQRCRMLRQVMPHFEHRLFLTATPHNGYTQSFSGLLEVLDPVRFQQRATLKDEDHRQIEAVVVRRLKSELNARSTVPPFARREVKSWPVVFAEQPERRLFDALAQYRNQGAQIAATMDRREAQLARFLLSILTKRLLSSSYAFARTWWSHVAGYELAAAQLAEADNAARRAQADVADDQERGLREEDAVRQGAAWLQSYRRELSPAAREVSEALNAIGWTPGRLSEPFGEKPAPPDARWDALWRWIEEKLLNGNGLRDDERLILFTEYKDTLDYLLWRFDLQGYKVPVIVSLFGGAPLAHREDIKQAFNDPGSPLRILVSTDAASEGLNFQESCRYVFHQEIPWNPMRLEQRNGRVDRHGQARDVFVYHFTSDEEADLRFLARVAEKVNQVREDLGSVGQVIEESVEEHLTRRRLAEPELERRVDLACDTVDSKQDTRGRDAGSEADYRKAIQALRATELQLGLTPEGMARVLQRALRSEGGDLVADEHASVGTITAYRIRPVPPTWEKLIDETVRLRKGDQASALPKLVFDPAYFEKPVSGRRVFRPRPDAILIRLGHPLMRRALGVFKRRLWQEDDTERWTILGAPFPHGTEALILLHALCVATNDLRETIHEEVVTWAFLIEAEHLAPVEEPLWHELKHLPVSPLPAAELRRWRKTFSDLWLDHRDALEAHLADHRAAWDAQLRQQLAAGLKQALDAERGAYQKRLAEIQRSAEKGPEAAEKLRRQLEKAERVALQRSFDEDANRMREARLRQLEQQVDAAEWERQHNHLMLLKERLERDRDRTIERTLPLRYGLARVDAQPVAVEYRVRYAEGGAQ